MLNEELKILISAYVDGELTSEEKDHIEEVLITDRQAQAYYRDLCKLSGTLNLWPDEALSPDLTQRLARNIEETTMKPTPKKINSSFFMGAGSALVMLIAVVLVGKLHNQTLTQLEQNKYETSSTVSSLNKDALESAELKTTQPLQVRPSNVSADQKNQRTFKGQSQQAATSAGKEMSDATSPQLIVTRKQTGLTSNGKDDSTPQIAQAISTVAGAAGEGAYPQSPRQESSIDFGDYDSSYMQETAPKLKTVQKKTVQLSTQHEAMNANEFRVASPMAGVVIHCTIDPCPIPTVMGSVGNTEEYDHLAENQFLSAFENPLSTFSIDVDTTSYSNIRRYLNNRQMPPMDSVRIEEMINYFSYDYPRPKEDEPFSITTDVTTAPWNSQHQLMRIALQGKTFQADAIPASNLVFLLDVSGSMNDPNKLPLLKNAFRMMVNQLGENERIAIVTYAGSAGLVLPSTPGSDKQAILQAIDRLNAGGSTAGGAGIQLAYQVAKENFIDGGNNRVIIATDGDFNVGVSGDGELIELIEEKRRSNIFLTVLGFGTGNFKDGKMEKLADHGNGTYHYIDTQNEAKKVLVHELGSTLFTIAKDVKLQIEFNPTLVKSYRLIGYENRMLAKEDFNDDTKDAGELGAGHTVTALYEIIPASSEEITAEVDPLKYQKIQTINNNELVTVKLRYKLPNENTSQLITQSVTSESIKQTIEGDFQFASAVAEFGMILRNSKFKGQSSYQHVLKAAGQARGEDAFGYRQEFINLVQRASEIDTRSITSQPMQFK